MYLEHINITVPSIDNTLHFLGVAFPDFHIRGEGQRSNFRWVHFGNNDTYISIYDYTDDTPAPENRTLNHAGFVINALAPLNARMQAAGYPLSEESNESPFRDRSYYHDKNGMEWEFIQYLSDSPEERNHYE